MPTLRLLFVLIIAAPLAGCAEAALNAATFVYKQGDRPGLKPKAEAGDPVAQTASTAEAWDIGQTCYIQGAMYEQPSGLGYVATCADGGLVQAFESGTASALWTMDASCGGLPLPPPLMRAVPIAL